jgi:enoyl-CoA hydratase
MRPEKLLIEPERLPFLASDAWQPLGLVDLDACPDTARQLSLPPFPLVGFGNPRHPLASGLDAVLEAPFTLDTLIRSVTQCPHAAAVAVQLLRATAGIEPPRALALESMAYGMLQGSAEHLAWLAARAVVTQNAERPSAGRIVAERQGAELRLTLDRPESHNAIDVQMRDQLYEALGVAALDPEIRVIRLRAHGRSFCIGGDLDEFGSTRDPASAHLIRSGTLPALRLVACAERLHAHIQGACIGAGLEMAAFAQRITARKSAWFQLPEIGMGLIPGAGGCVSVPRRIGRQRAALLMLAGSRINATTALRWGLIDAIEAHEPADIAAPDAGIVLTGGSSPGA